MTPPDVYTVKSGDTLYAIAFRFGLDHRDIARWNQLLLTELIRPGQTLKLEEPPAATQPPPQQTTPRERRLVTSRPYEPPAAPVKTPPVRNPKPASSQKTAPPVSTNTKISWQWPAGGKILQSFDAADPGRTGLDIGGTEGQAVKAAARGTVVYSGSGLIGYGELIIIKHSDKLLSAYAHNRNRLVRENDRVKAGQKIAEMGRNGSNRVMLHFEVREFGSPVNPLRYLPKR